MGCIHVTIVTWLRKVDDQTNNGPQRFQLHRPRYKGPLVPVTFMRAATIIRDNWFVMERPAND